MLTNVTTCDMLLDWNLGTSQKGGERLNEVRFDPAKLIAAMKSARIGDTKLAEAAGISRQMIFYMKKGERNGVSAEILGRIAKVLEINVSELMTGNGTVDDDKPPMQKLPESIRRLAEVASRLSDVRREELLRIATSLEELEREQSIYPMPVQVMDALLSLAKEVGAGDVLIQLQAMIPQSASSGHDDARGS